MSALPPVTDVYGRQFNVRLVPGSMYRSNLRHHSINSSARASSVGGTAKPIALAVFTLMTSSNLIGACKIGRVGPPRCQTDIGYCLLEQLV